METGVADVKGNLPMIIPLTGATFSVTDTKLFVPAVTLLTKNRI